MASRVSCLFGLGISAALGMLGSEARADSTTSGVDVTWVAPAGCPSRDWVMSELTKLLPKTPSSHRLQARAVVDCAASDRWTLHLSTAVDGQTDERDFAAASCAELAATTAVVLAIAVQPITPSASAPLPPPPPPPVPPVAPEIPPPLGLPSPAPTAAPSVPPTSPSPSSSTPPSPEPAPSPPSSPPHRTPSAPNPLLLFAASASATGSVGALATPAFGVEAGLSWLARKGRLELDGLWYPSTQIQGSVPNTAGSFGLLGAALSGCYSPWNLRGFELGGCLGVQAGQLSFEPIGTGIRFPSPGHSPWLAPTGGALLIWRPLARLHLRASLDLLAPLYRKDFIVAGINEPIHTPAPVAGQASIGAEIPFP